MTFGDYGDLLICDRCERGVCHGSNNCLDSECARQYIGTNREFLCPRCSLSLSNRLPVSPSAPHPQEEGADPGQYNLHCNNPFRTQRFRMEPLLHVHLTSRDYRRTPVVDAIVNEIAAYYGEYASEWVSDGLLLRPAPDVASAASKRASA